MYVNGTVHLKILRGYVQFSGNLLKSVGNSSEGISKFLKITNVSQKVADID